MDSISSYIPAWLAESNSYCVVVINSKGDYLYQNEVFKQKYLAYPFAQNTTPELYTRLQNNQKITIEAEMTAREFPQKNKWIHWECSTLKNENQEIIGIICIGNDITIQKNQTQELQDLKILEIIAGHTSNAIIITDTNRKITWINEEFTILTGYTSTEAIGKTPASLLQFEKTDPQTIQYIREKLNQREYVKFQICNKGKFNQVYWTDIEIQPLTDENEVFIGFIAVQTDITAQKKAEEIALTSQSQLFSTINNTPHVAIQWYDEQGVVISWNPASETLYGWTAKEAVGKTLDKLIYTPEENQVFLDKLQEIKKTGLPQGSYESPVIHKDGILKWILTTVFSIPMGSEQIGFVCIDVDITSQKKAEQDLLESKAKYKSVVSAIAEGLVVQGLDDKILMANQAASDILSLTLNQLLGKDSYDPHWQTLHEDGTPFAPEDHPTMITLRTGKSVDNVIMNVHTGKDKRKIISVNSRPIYNYKNEMSAVVASFTDITEQKEAEHKLKESEALLRASMEASLEAIFLLEAIKDNQTNELIDFTVKDLNQNAAKQLQNTREELMGKSIVQNCGKYHDKTRFEQLKQVLENQKPIEEEFFMDIAGAGRGWYYQQIVPMPHGIAIYNRNITERKEAEHKIITQNEALKSIAWQQSHEVRRPVATILGLINLIEDDFKTKTPLSTEYIGYLLITTKELDKIIHKIVENTYTTFDERETN